MKKILKWVGIVFGVLIVLGIVANVGSSSKTPSTDSTSSSKNEITTNQDPDNNKAVKETKDLTPKVGDVTKLGDRQFIVNSVRRSGGFDYNTPKKGKEYVIINVTIKNLGKDEIDYNPYDFKVQDANGAQESQTFASLDDSLSSGTLAPEGQVSGSIPFEVPIGDTAKLIFQPSFWSSQRVVVDLGNK